MKDQEGSDTEIEFVEPLNAASVMQIVERNL